MSIEAPVAPAVPAEHDLEWAAADVQEVAQRTSEQYQFPQEVENRIEDKEILGKAVSVKLAIETTARETISVADATWAEARNMMASPLLKYRELRKDIAQDRLTSKQDRATRREKHRNDRYASRENRLNAKLEEKRQAAQDKVDSTASLRLRERRQHRADQKHEARAAKVASKLESHKSKIDARNEAAQQKVDSYRDNVLSAREFRHKLSTDAAEGRFSRSEERSAERRKTLESNRDTARVKAERARARKELRKTLRGPENRASLRETREILAEVFGDGDKAAGRDALHSLARDTIRRDRQEAVQRRADGGVREAQRVLRGTESLISRSKNDAVNLDRSAEHDDMQAKLLRTDTIPQLRAQLEQAEETYGDDPTQMMINAAKQQLEQAEARVVHLEADALDKRQRAQSLREKAKLLQEKTIQEQKAAIEQREIEAAQQRVFTERARETAAASARSILGEDTAKQERNI